MKSLTIAAMFLAALPLAAQQPPPPKQPPPKPTLEAPDDAPVTPAPVTIPKATLAKKPVASNPEGKVVEEIVARVNNEIITRSELERSKAGAADEAKQDCQDRCTPEQLKQLTDDRRANALRDLIDQSLLVQRGKDMGLSVEPDVIKALDQIRIENKLDSMEALEKAVTASGTDWEDFKNNIRDGILTKKVISEEVGSHISSFTSEEIQKYYDAHKQDFVRPEEVALRSIEINTAGKSDAEIAELKKKADTAHKRVEDGEDFGEIAKRYSDGSTAKQGGYLGVYKRGELSKQLEDVAFKLKRNDITDVLETKQGFLILQVLEHYQEGVQPLSIVENEVRDKLYSQKMEPALRDYLKTLREESYVVIKPGYQDAAGSANSEIQEVSATPEVTKSRKGHKKFLLFGKRSGSTASSS